MNKIMLITTEGCIGCDIMKNSINEAIKKAKVKVELEIVDVNKLYKRFLRQYKITDFPATLFFKDEDCLFRWVGSTPAVVVLQWINVQFK